MFVHNKIMSFSVIVRMFKVPLFFNAAYLHLKMFVLLLANYCM